MTTVTRSRRWRTIALKSILSIAVLALVLSSISWASLRSAWGAVTWSGVALSLLLLPVQILFRVLRWKGMLRHARPDTTTSEAASTVIAGYAFAVVTPAEVGDVAFRMERHAELDRARVVGIVGLEKVVHSLLSLLPGAPALLLMLTHDMRWAVTAFVIVVLITGGVVFGHHTIERMHLGKRWPKLRRVDDALRAFSAVPRSALLVAVAWTLGILAVYVAQEYVLVNAVTSLGLFETWNAFWAGIGLRTLAPFFIMDLGIREASHVAFFGAYGVDAASAMTVSMLMFIVNVFLPTIVGLGVFLTDRRGRS